MNISTFSLLFARIMTIEDILCIKFKRKIDYKNKQEMFLFIYFFFQQIAEADSIRKTGEI